MSTKSFTFRFRVDQKAYSELQELAQRMDTTESEAARKSIKLAFELIVRQGKQVEQTVSLV